MNNIVDAPDWSTIPAPQDDGTTRHLPGTTLPSAPLTATDGSIVDLSTLIDRTVYAYPRTGRPGVPNPDGWDMIPGARGCSPQACSFRDQFSELKNLGVDHWFGLSTQDTALIIKKGTIEHVFYSVFPPDRSASDVIVGLSVKP